MNEWFGIHMNFSICSFELHNEFSFCCFELYCANGSVGMHSTEGHWRTWLFPSRGGPLRKQRQSSRRRRWPATGTHGGHVTLLCHTLRFSTHQINVEGKHTAGIAQLGERQTEDLKVACSIHAHRILLFVFPFSAIH
jgi:hypothetical protein